MCFCFCFCVFSFYLLCLWSVVSEFFLDKCVDVDYGQKGYLFLLLSRAFVGNGRLHPVLGLISCGKPCWEI
ncbi:hypothetical protein J3Q64DRAFT_1709361 [Phycomyces blakesleeanus]|uniref:Secreted protein n=1 Tax=Phycomyces blakesleeanus TaxID=4837 RepID=A0ABR3BEL5_PHYBL